MRSSELRHMAISGLLCSFDPTGEMGDVLAVGDAGISWKFSQNLTDPFTTQSGRLEE
jgi:hypothetical protein